MILGWSQQIFTVIAELVAANENQPKPLDRRPRRTRQGRDGRRDPRAGRRHGGGPRSSADRAARWTSTTSTSPACSDRASIVVLAPETDEPDAEVIKTILAITNDPDRRAEPYHIVAEMRDRAQRRGRPAGRPGRGRADPVRGGHLADHRPDLPPVRPVGRLRRAPRLRRRRDLPDRAADVRGAHVRRDAAGLRGRRGHRAAAGGRLAAPQPADGHGPRRGRSTDRDRGRRRPDPARRGRAGPGRRGRPAVAVPRRGPGADARPRLEPPGGRDHRASSTPTSPTGSEVVVVGRARRGGEVAVDVAAARRSPRPADRAAPR